MGTFANIVLPRTKETLRAQLLQALRGVGFVRHSGTGTGAVVAFGTAEGDYSVIVEITTGGEPGEAAYRYSLDDGNTWSDAATVPTATVALPGTGAAVSFVSSTIGNSFVAGDRFSFLVATPTLPTTAWQPFSTPLALLDGFAASFEDVDAIIAAIGAGGFLSSAKGLWLDLLAQDVYDEKRKPAVTARHTFRLTDAAGEGPHTITAGQLVVEHASGLRFTNTDGGTLTLGGTLDLTFEAEKPGSAYNIGAGSTLRLVTTLAGVSVANPGVAGSSLVEVGADRETDEALADRCSKKWGSLGIGATDDGYALWALSSSSTITRAKVRPSATVPGHVEIFVAGPSGGAPINTAAVESAIRKRVPTCVTAGVTQASDVTITVSGTVYATASLLAVAQGEVETRLAAYLATVPIGGVEVGSERIVPRERLIAEVMAAAGVVDFDPVFPADDTTITETAIPVLSLALNWVGV